MLRQGLTIFTLFLLTVSTASAGSLRLNEFMQVLGKVTDTARPVEQALVIAFDLTEYRSSSTWTDPQGAFRIAALPAGIYRIIAIKHGFAPAVATIIPDRHDHRLALRLKPASELSEDEKKQIWEIRRSVPADILRELDLALPPPQDDEGGRFSGRMTSLTGMDSPSQSYARTAVGVRGHLGDWTLDFTGSLHRIEDEPIQSSSLVEAESSGLAFELKSAPGQAYRIASTRSRWQPEPGAESAAFEAHQFEWSGQDTQVELRYLNQENLFGDRPFDSEMIELSGRKTILESTRSSLGVAVRLGQQESVSAFGATTARTADLSASAAHRVGSAVRIEYGLRTRVSDDGSEWLPQGAAEWKIGSRSAIIISGLYKVYEDQGEMLSLPAIVFVNTGSPVAPRYRYSVGLRSGTTQTGTFKAVATVAEIDSLVRVMFDDSFDQFWEGLFFEDGDRHEDLTLTMSRTFGGRLAVDVSTSAGRAVNQRNPVPLRREKAYVTGIVQSMYRPSGTSFDVSYRYLEQPGDKGNLDNERLLVRMGQSLYLPLDLRLLLGVDLARGSASPLVRNGESLEPLETRLVGGLSFAF